MNAAAAAFVLAPALALGSFLNVVVVRVPARRSLLRPPSSCGSCGTEILWRDNIPVLSYLLLRGRCRHCEAWISPTYPLVEAVTALLIVACVAVYGPRAEAAVAAGFCTVLVVLSAIDAHHRILSAALVRAAVLTSRQDVSARKMRIPLVPFLSLGALIALFFGDAILDADLGLF